jgi:hypothetical protein
MKKIFIAMLMVLCLALPASARFDNIRINLDDSNNNSIVDLALTSGVAVYSERINVERAGGFVSLLITEDIAGGAGDVDISVEYSMDGTNFYTANVSDLAGTVTTDGVIATGVGNTTALYTFPLRPFPWMRYKFDPDADSEVTAVHSHIVDR